MIDRSKWYVCYRDDTTPLTWINGKAIVFPSEEVAKRFIYGLGWKGLVPYKAEIYWIFGNIKFEDIMTILSCLKTRRKMIMMTNNTDLRWYVFNGKDSTPLTWDEKAMILHLHSSMRNLLVSMMNI